MEVGNGIKDFGLIYMDIVLGDNTVNLVLSTDMGHMSESSV